MIIRETARELSRTVPVLPDNYKHYTYMRSHTKTLKDAAIFQNAFFALDTAGQRPYVYDGLSVSANFFPLLGVHPLLGHDFSTGPKTATDIQEIMITYPLWASLFNKAPDIVGKTIKVGGEQAMVMGVLPPNFKFPPVSELYGSTQTSVAKKYDVFQLLVPSSDDLENDVGNFNYLVIARRNPHETIERIRSELAVLQTQVSTSGKYHLGASVTPLLVEVTGKVRGPFTILFSLAIGLLILAGLNFSILIQERVIEQEGERALIIALGGSHFSMLRPLLYEVLVLTTIATMLATVLAGVELYFLRGMLPPNLPRIDDLSIGWLPLVLCAVLSTCMGVMVALGGMPRTLMQSPATLLRKSSSLHGGKPGQDKLVLGMLAIEVAVAYTLTTVAMLTFSDLHTLIDRSAHLRLAEAKLIATTLELPKYRGASGGEARIHFIQSALLNLLQLPGVEAAGVMSALPLSGTASATEVKADSVRSTSSSDTSLLNLRYISPGLLAAVGATVVDGRDLISRGSENADSALISESAAKALWSQAPSLEQGVTVGKAHYRIVGVARDDYSTDLRTAVPTVYVPFWRFPYMSPVFLVRFAPGKEVTPLDLARIISQTDPEVPIRNSTSVSALVADTLSGQRFRLLLAGVLAGVAVILTGCSLYGVLAYWLKQRVHEIGVRLALGAPRIKLVGLIANKVVVTLALGSIFGVGGTLAIVKVLQGTLGIADHAMAREMLAAVLVLAIAAVVAATPSVYRILRMNPGQLLRV